MNARAMHAYLVSDLAQGKTGLLRVDERLAPSLLSGALGALEISLRTAHRHKGFGFGVVSHVADPIRRPPM